MIPETVFDTALGHATEGAGVASGAAGFVSETNASLAQHALRLGALSSGPHADDRLSRDEAEWTLLRHLVSFGRIGSAGGRSGATPLQIKLAIDYLEMRRVEAFSLEEVAAYCGCAVPVLMKGFEAEVGMSLSHFRNERRVDTVREHLAHHPSTPSDLLAASVGLETVEALEACFRNVLGIGVERFRAGTLN